MSRYFVKSSLICLIHIICFSSVAIAYEHPHESAETIYRDIPFTGQDHAGLYYKYIGIGEPSDLEKHEIIHMQTAGWTIDTLETFENGSGTYRGAYYLPRVKDDEDVTRMAIITTALAQEGADYVHWNTFFSDYKDPDNGTFRCDGLVEYCYEIGLGDDWEPGDNEGIVINDDWEGFGQSVMLTPNVQRRAIEDYPSETTFPDVVVEMHSTGRNPYIELYFDERMAPAMFTLSNVTIQGSSSGIHDFDITYGCYCSPTLDDQDNNIVNFGASAIRLEPINQFNYGETVTVTLSTDVTDFAGNGLENPYQLSFNIQDEPSNPPTSITVNANSNDTSIDPYQTITISGTATYNTGIGVDGTATINTGDNIYTAAVIDGSFSRSVTGPSSSGNVTVSVSDGSLTGNDSVYISVSGDGSTSSYDLETYVAYDIQDVGNGYCSYSYKDVFTTSDYAVNGLFIIDNANLSSDLDFKLKFYNPDGTQYGSDLEGLNAFDKDWEWGYWYWGFLIDGSSMAYNPGKYKVRFYVDNDRKATHYYVVGWNFTRHLICKSADSSDPWMYHDPTNVFSPDDTRAVAWHEFEDVGQEIYVKTNYYAPDGSLYLAGNEHLCEFNLPENHWYDWYRYYQPMTIKGAAPEFMCGDWTVKFYVKNPGSGAWQQKYTDVFRIEESTAPTITSISASPSSPIETQSVTVDISASDNNHLKKLVLHWNDGTDHTQTWDNINSGSTIKSQNIGSFSSGTPVEYWAEVWDESGNRAESIYHTIIVQTEIISTPTQPSGESSLQVNQDGTYTTGGSTSSLGHGLEYQFDWGDTTPSTWNGTSQSKFWSAEGYYFVKAHARCQTHTSRISGWSNSLMVTIDSTPPVVDINTNGGVDFQTDQPQVVINGPVTDAEPTSGLVSVTINTGATNEGTLLNWQFTVDLVEGANPLTITATDNSGNIGIDTIVVTYSPPAISVIPASRGFGTVEVGYCGTNLTFTVENIGGGTLIGNATVPAPFNIESGGSYTLTTGQTQVVTVSFCPTLAQPYSEDITFTGDGGTTRQVTGTGGIPSAPEINIKQDNSDIPDDTENYDFGTVLVGGSLPVTFTIENLGNASLDLTGSPIVDITGTHASDFTVTQEPITPISSSNVTPFEITFTPSGQGVRSAAVSILNNDSDENPYDFSVMGYILHVTWNFDPNTYIPESSVDVCLEIMPDAATQVYAVEDAPPIGWTVSDIAEGGTWDDVNKKVKWGPFFDSNIRTLCYYATPPVGETGVKTFLGTASFDGSDELFSRTITECSITIGDFDNDCDVDWEDLAILAGNWLEGL